MDNAYIIPEGALPPQEVRITNLKAEAYPDGRRVRITIELSPFQQRPDLTAAIFTPGGQEVAAASIVEAMTYRMTFTMHLRGVPPSGVYRLHVNVAYPEIGEVAQADADFETHGEE